MNLDCYGGSSNLNFETGVVVGHHHADSGKKIMPTISLYRLTAPVGSIKNGDSTRRPRRQIDYGVIVGAVVLVGLLIAIIWN